MTLEYTETQDDVEQDGGEENHVTDPKAVIPFEDLGVSDAVLASIREMGFEMPTDVQAEAIPHALAGHDLLVQSRTGSGKTAAFAIPAASKLIDLSKNETQALVLAPTRELAMQVEKEVARIGARSDLTTVAVYGGAAMGPQVDALDRGVHFVAATPGRLLDHIRR
ncbi:MAG: DEAD/DEAH box helicase, partial [Deltaproteobacteria bacterium]|nr:DEAD/DEAH box helicase [Deltaproteobacteria bacterium]